MITAFEKIADRAAGHAKRRKVVDGQWVDAVCEVGA
jgi:hypothetical protein